tara:strand:- start:219 stop:338 length:120 start_codon:yes stop_codon:yes gene_type:complete
MSDCKKLKNNFFFEKSNALPWQRLKSGALPIELKKVQEI